MTARSDIISLHCKKYFWAVYSLYKQGIVTEIICRIIYLVMRDCLSCTVINCYELLYLLISYTFRL
jgi:hypothetical protein